MMYWLLALRLRWYSQATALLLLRRWQAIVLVAGTVAPVGGSLLGVASYPVVVSLAEQHGMAWRLAAIGLWQGCWALWTLMQRDQVRGGPFADFTRALPLPARQTRYADLIVLLVSDTPLFIPFVAAAVALAAQHGASWETARGVLLIVFLIASQLSAQLAVLQERRRAFVSFVVADVVVAAALGLGGPAAAAALALPVAAALWALVVDLPMLPQRAGDLVHRAVQPLLRLMGYALARLPPAGRLSLGILYRQHLASMLGKFFSCLLIAFASKGLMTVWNNDGRCLPMAFIAAGFIALSASGLYRHLQMAHDDALGYMGALPLARRWTLLADTAAVLSFGAPFVAALGATLWADAGVPSHLVAAYLASFVLLVVLLRGPQLFSNRHAVVTSAVLAVSWTFAAATVLQP